jgi:hypothetical protein
VPDVYAPFTTATMVEGSWFRDRGYTEPDGVPGPPAATVGAGDLPLTSNGLTLSLGLGRAHVRGAYYERTGTAATLTVPANTNATNSRVDRVVIRRDLTARTVTPLLLQGTAAGTPVPPALTQVENGVWDMPCHRVTVPPASGTTLTLVDERPWIDPASGQLIGYGAGSPVRPTTGLYDGMRLFEADTDRWIERRNGVWRLASVERDYEQGISNLKWAGTSYGWVAGMGAKIVQPADGLYREWLATINSGQINNAPAWVRMRQDLAAGGGRAAVTYYYPNTNGWRIPAGGQVGWGAGGYILGDQQSTWFLEAYAEVSQAPDVVIPSLSLLWD